MVEEPLYPPIKPYMGLSGYKSFEIFNGAAIINNFINKKNNTKF